MERLFEIDLKDYKETDKVFKRPSARAIILIKDKIALVYSKKEKYFKFPGGGIHADEDKKEALIREVREEVGMVVIPDSIREFGSVLRRQKGNVDDDTMFEQENFYYLCDVEDEIVSQELDEYEDEAGFELRLPSCSSCLAMNPDKVPAGKLSISTSNRNFVGRQGLGARTVLASPLVVAASAITGVITDPRKI